MQQQQVHPFNFGANHVCGQPAGPPRYIQIELQDAVNEELKKVEPNSLPMTFTGDTILTNYSIVKKGETNYVVVEHEGIRYAVGTKTFLSFFVGLKGKDFNQDFDKKYCNKNDA